MKLIDLEYYTRLYSAIKVYMNHENWLEILKEKGYVDKMYERCDYFHIFYDATAHSVIHTFNYPYNYVRFVNDNSNANKLVQILSYEERIIKDIIE
jgi:hypothetical protein